MPLSSLGVAAARSAGVFADEKGSVILRNAVKVIEKQGWSEDRAVTAVGPDVRRVDIISAIIEATGFTVYERRPAAHGSFTNPWNAKHYVQSNVEAYIVQVSSGKRSRKGFQKVMDYVCETVGLEDLQLWNDEYCTGIDEVMDVLERAAQLAESRDD